MKDLQLLDDIEKLNNDITDLSEDIAELTKNPDVNLFILKSSLLKNLLEKRRLLNETYFKKVEKTCDHSLLYALDSFKLNNQELYICKCLNCETIVEKNDSEKIVFTNKSYESLKAEYYYNSNKSDYYIENKKDNSVNIYTSGNELSKRLLIYKYKR